MSDELKKAVKSSIGWLELANYDSNPTDADSRRKGLCFVGDTIMKWTGDEWVSANIGVAELDELDDVAVTTPANGHLLVYNGTSSDWENKAVSGDIAIDEEGAVTIADDVIDAEKIEPIAATNGTYGVPFVIPVTNTGAAEVTIFNGNAPFKMRIIDAWAISTQANSGTWKITDGTNDITSAIAYSTSDKGISRATTLDDANYTINANGTLKLVSSEETDKAVVYISAIKVS